MSDIRLGVIGMSPGNGHPYSWSAILNGYDPAEMENCGFPVIPRYLEQQRWPEAQLRGAVVTHVWTQDQDLSASIARAANIPVVVDAPNEMVGEIDGVLLARDDAENHLRFARTFLEAGLPVYIDKPIAMSRAALEDIRALEQYPGQIFTCSALRYAEELRLSPTARSRVGEVSSVRATTPKAWVRYAPHIVEPVTVLLGCEDPIEVISVTCAAEGAGSVRLRWGSDVDVSLTATGQMSGSLAIDVMGHSGSVRLEKPSAFHAFRAALADFLSGVREGGARTDWCDVERIVDIIEAGVCR